MSSLTDFLNRIRVWLQGNCPAADESITPGLSLEEIQAITLQLPFSLPSEVYELYQWSRGHTLDTQTIYTHIFEPYEGMALYNLEAAMDIFPTFEDEIEECDVSYIGKPLFPVFGTDASYLCVVGDWKDKKSSPIILVSDIRETEHRYTSLTSMMSTVAEFLEADAVSFDEKGHVNWNKEKFSSIYLKNNTNLLDFSLERLKQELIIRQSHPELQEMTENSFLGDISSLDRERRNLPSRQLDFKVIEPLIIAMEDENESVSNLARQALEELDYDFEQ